MSLLGVWLKGINFGIDFTGGFITEYSTSESVNQNEMKSLLDRKLSGPYILAAAENNTHWTVRQPEIAGENTAEQSLLAKSKSGLKQTETSQFWLKKLIDDEFFATHGVIVQALDSDYIGTQIGEELVNQGGLAMLTALIMIMLYLSARFEWRFALGAILALFHDVVIVVGLFAWSQLEFNLTVLASLLAIIGYSLNDSIVVADRIRELMLHGNSSDLSVVVDNALKSTLIRTSITSGTTLATIAAVWWLGGAPLQGFSVALFSGILVGTYSSLCISSTFPELAGLDVEHFLAKPDAEEIALP
jgi:preprotein translocase subunit SecF